MALKQFYRQFAINKNTRLWINSTVVTPNFSVCYKSTNSKIPKIYTKTGDKGTSLTFTGERRSKDNDIFEALGTVDELSCAIGLAREYLTQSSKILDPQLVKVQCTLQDLSSSIATPKSTARTAHLERTEFDKNLVQELEQWIDNHTENLPALKNFILPSGGKASASLHMARAICRRAERRMIPLYKCEEIDETLLKYINRLSDYLFTVARYATKLEGFTETVYYRPTKK